MYSINVLETLPRVAKSSFDKNALLRAATMAFATLRPKLGTARKGAIKVSLQSQNFQHLICTNQSCQIYSPVPTFHYIILKPLISFFSLVEASIPLSVISFIRAFTASFPCDIATKSKSSARTEKNAQ